MERTSTAELPASAGRPVRLQGWLHHLRRLRHVGFLLVRDAGGIAQVVVDPDQAEALSRLHHESVLDVEGLAVAEPAAPGGVEVRQAQVRVLAEAIAPPPVVMHHPRLDAQLPTLLDHAAVTLRHPERRAGFAIAAASVAAFRDVLRARHFIEIHTPKIVAAATESGASTFELDYFGRRAYLAQSPQFYKQVMVGVFERVFEVGPVFRAEPHDTPRHLNEYVSLDAEMGFVADHHDVMRVLGEVVAGMVAGVREEAPAAVELLGLDLPEVPAPVPEVHFLDAQRMIAAATGEDLAGELDLAPAHEAWLGEWALREHGAEFLFVTGYPMAKRPFYTHPDPGRPGCSNGFDLLFRGLELVTGGQRLHRHEDYLAALAARGEDPAPFAGYLEAFLHGMPPHGGFAIGLERWVARLTGRANLRETALFPRDLTRLSP